MHNRLTLVPLLTLAFVGCGGGGGGGGGGDVNTSNATLAAKESYSAAKGLLAFGSQSSAGTKASARPTTPAASLEGSGDRPRFDVRSFLRDQLAAGLAHVRGQQLAQVRYEETIEFEGGGSFSLIYDDVDNSDTFSTGDTFEFVFSNLVSEEGSEVCTTNGSLLINQVVIDNPANYDKGVAPYSASLTLTINVSEVCVTNGVTVTETFNGAFETMETLTSEQLSLTFATVGTVGEVTDLVITETQTLGSTPTWTQTISGKVTAPLLGTVSFSTPTPLSGTGDPETSDPTAGVLEITDGVDVVRITISGTTVTIEFKSGSAAFQLVETISISELE